MKPNLLQTSWLLLAASILLLVGLTAFESALIGLSLGAERILSFALLVLPAAVGALLAGWSLGRGEGRRGLAITALILNLHFAVFHLMVILFAG